MVTKYAVILAFILIKAFILSLFGRYHWSLALLSHFKVQYCVGGTILFAILLISGSYILAICAFSVAIYSYVQTRISMTEPWNFSPPTQTLNAPVLTVTQYNKYYKNHRHDSIRKALTNSDIIIMQEVENTEVEILKENFFSTHPFGLPDGSPRPNDLMVFSKY